MYLKAEHTSSDARTRKLSTSFNALTLSPMSKNTAPVPGQHSRGSNFLGESSAPDIPKDVQPQRPLWALAYDCLERENPKLAQQFRCCLGINTATAGIENSTNPGFDEVAQKAFAEIQKAQDSKERSAKTKLQKYSKKAIEVIIASKDLIASAASVGPHAALAWSGVSLLLPVSSP